MAEEIINDIYYRLDEENLTAEVIQKDDNRGDIIIPDAVVFNEITYRVTSIGRRAFADCQWLTTINIPNSVTSIGDHAFHGCDSLTSITLPFVGSSRTANGTADAVFQNINQIEDDG